MDRIAVYIPHWLAWPVNLLSTAAALTGAGFVFYGAGFADGGISPFVWGAGSFGVASILWWLAEVASANRPL